MPDCTSTPWVKEFVILKWDVVCIDDRKCSAPSFILRCSMYITIYTHICGTMKAYRRNELFLWVSWQIMGHSPPSALSPTSSITILGRITAQRPKSLTRCDQAKYLSRSQATHIPSTRHDGNETNPGCQVNRLRFPLLKLFTSVRPNFGLWVYSLLLILK